MVERIPLLKDHHTHPSVYGAMANCLDLRPIASKAEALRLIGDRDEELVFVLGWNDGLYGFSDDDLAALPPVLIINTSLHGFLANDGARGILALDHPEIVEHLDDQNWIERNLPAILKLIPDVRGCDAATLLGFYDTLLEQGIWYAEEMLMPGPGVVDAFEQAGLGDRTRKWADPAVYAWLDEQHRAAVHGIKLFTDGALGAYTAAMLEPLRTGQEGLLLFTDEGLRHMLDEVADFGKPIAAHALGDRASGQLVDAIADVQAGRSSMPPVRIEHAEFITLDQARRARDLDVTLSMQPNFSTESEGYADRLTPEQCNRINPMRMLIDDIGFVPGQDLLFGSDGMPHGTQYALQASLFPPRESQELTLEEFVAGYCMPDEAAGWIEVDIDPTARQVEVTNINTPRETST